jgi:hypothetical protein
MTATPPSALSSTSAISEFNNKLHSKNDRTWSNNFQVGATDITAPKYPPRHAGNPKKSQHHINDFAQLNSAVAHLCWHHRAL